MKKSKKLWSHGNIVVPGGRMSLYGNAPTPRRLRTAASRSSMVFGAVFSVLLLFAGVFIPWQGNAFPQNLLWLLLPFGVATIVALFSGRFLALSLFPGLLLCIFAFTLLDHRTYLAGFLVYLAGLELGATVRTLWHKKKPH